MRLDFHHLTRNFRVRLNASVAEKAIDYSEINVRIEDIYFQHLSLTRPFEHAWPVIYCPVQPT